MRHPNSRALFAIWDKRRGSERAPLRSDLTPDVLRELLGDMFVLDCDADEGFPLRVAGTRVCALLGQDCKGTSLTSLFEAESRKNLTDIVVEVAGESLVAVAGVTASDGDGEIGSFELSFLPFRARAHTPLSVIGALAPLTPSRLPVSRLTLTSWRYLGHETERAGPRRLRRVPLTRGLTVYEGLR